MSVSVGMWFSRVIRHYSIVLLMYSTVSLEYHDDSSLKVPLGVFVRVKVRVR